MEFKSHLFQSYRPVKSAWLMFAILQACLYGQDVLQPASSLTSSQHRGESVNNVNPSSQNYAVFPESSVSELDINSPDNSIDENSYFPKTPKPQNPKTPLISILYLFKELNILDAFTNN